nr:uracil-DNA glycosylase [Maliibacterium massiliense]
MPKDKQARYEALKRECDAFFAQIYQPNRRIIVFGEGNLDADVMLIGEAPGEQETLQGRPFVGAAGKNLDAFLSGVDLPREALYIGNTVKFRPTKASERTGKPVNRPPTREEILLCSLFLQKEILLVRPRVIATLGNIALRAVSGDGKATIGQVHGQALPCHIAMEKAAHDCVLFPLYHPASILYNRALQQTYQEDMRALRAYLHAPGAAQ